MFGRYSLDKNGIMMGDSKLNYTSQSEYEIDSDNIIPICVDEYFQDDIVTKLIDFIRQAYGEDTLEENLSYIARNLGGSDQPRIVIRKYFLNDFYSDHLKLYQKRPIYWLFSSGKKNGFKCLCYFHRYQPDLVARIRTEYIHELQSRYNTELEELSRRMDGLGNSEKVKVGKKIKQVRDQAQEIHTYEEKIHHLADQMIDIDFDDGIKVNYALFKDVLEKIK